MLISNADKLARAWERRASAITGTMRAATSEAVKTLLAASKDEIKKGIYDKPIPTKAQQAAEKGLTVTRGGKEVPAGFITTKKSKKRVLVPLGKQASKKAWKRTGNLRRSEKMKVLSPYIGIVENTAKYARARHDMGMPGAKLKTKRVAPWRTNAIRRTRLKIRDIYRLALRRAVTEGVLPGFGDLD
jgi:hypothetical protein